MISFFVKYDIALNSSLQIGDLIYACPTMIYPGAETEQHATADSNNMGSTHAVGILRDINIFGAPQFRAKLFVDETVISNPYQPNYSDFIMFSKYNQGDAGVLGYYAEVKFVNNSKEKAELFAFSSEVIINSK